MKLHDKTPDCVISFLSGSLPGSALLHLRQLSLFGMISRLGDNILRTIAIDMLVEAKPNCLSWFQQIRNLTILYGLPHPLKILEDAPTNLAYKRCCKQKILVYWRNKLQLGASKLRSLKYLKPQYLSLTTPNVLNVERKSL